jgi:hypothetical protein
MAKVRACFLLSFFFFCFNNAREQQYHHECPTIQTQTTAPRLRISGRRPYKVHPHLQNHDGAVRSHPRACSRVRPTFLPSLPQLRSTIFSRLPAST